MCYNFAQRISFAEHWKLFAESSEFHLTLSRVHRAHFFQHEICIKKRDILIEKREREMALKNRELRPKAVMLTRMHCKIFTHHIYDCSVTVVWRRAMTTRRSDASCSIHCTSSLYTQTLKQKVSVQIGLNSCRI